MAIEYSCTCGTRVKAPNDAVGKRAQCNRCSAVLTVPDPDDPRWPPGAKRPENPKRVPDAPPPMAASGSQPRPAMPYATPPASQVKPAPQAERAASQAMPSAAPFMPAAPPANPIPLARPAASMAAPIAAPVSAPTDQHTSVETLTGDFSPLAVDDIDGLLAPADYAPISTPIPEQIKITNIKSFRAPRVEEVDETDEGDAVASADMTATDWVLAIAFSAIGGLMGVAFLIQGRSKAAKMIGVSAAAGIVWGAILQMITQAVRLNSMP